jgi:uncharacterized protein
MKVVIDTNVIISGIFWSGPPYEVLNRWRHKKITAICSEEILGEISAILREFKLPEAQINGWVDFITKNSIMVRPTCRVDVCLDKDDNKFLEAAEAGKADYIVTGDRHLLTLKEHKNTRIITPQEFTKKHR